LCLVAADVTVAPLFNRFARPNEDIARSRRCLRARAGAGKRIARERPTAEVNMKLKAVQSLPSIKLAGRVPGDLHADLITYAEYYREVLGEPIDLWPLVVQMLRTFMHSDRAFRAWRRQNMSGAAARVDGMRSDGQESA